MDLSIKNTTKNQRREIVKTAIALSITDNDMPTDKALEIMKEYVEGTTEIEDVQKKIIAMYKEGGDA